MSSNASSSDRDSDNSHEAETTRPNRWQGPTSTWRDFTKDERGLAASLDTLRNQDLSLHLFNAHSLKRKAREFEEAEGSGLKTSQLQDTRRFVPPKVWTAWPLPPGDVPRSGDEIGEEDELEVYTLKRREKNWPSRELEEALTAVTLKQAKEMFRKRESDEEAIQGQAFETEKSIKIIPVVSTDDVGDDSEESRDPSPEPSQDEEARWNGSVSSSQPEPEAKDALKKPLSQTLRSVISTDDERSSQLLRPSIRHTLSKLDDVLMALHHARNTCHQYSRSDAGTDDEGKAGSVVSAVSEDGSKRPVGRPRRLQPSRNELDETELASPTPSELFRTKKTHRGRPQKAYPRLDNETQQEYVVRIARIQKKPLPSFAPPLESRPSRSTSPSRQHRVPVHRATEEELVVSRNKKLGLRDWSEVLGAAALVGFDPSVIERATQRCATLFGESMSMRTLVEAPFAAPEDLTDLYQQQLIPDFGVEDDLNLENPSNGRRNNQRQRKRSKSKSKEPSRCCPIRNCARGGKPFRDHYSLQRHLKNVHKISDISEVDSTAEDSEDYVVSNDEEEMEGGIHVDGFLQPVKLLSKEPKDSKRRNTAGRASSRSARKPSDESTADVSGKNSVEESEN